MRFSFGLVNPSGKFTSPRGTVPERHPSTSETFRAVRLEDKEQFRVHFENDWTIPVTVTMQFEGNMETHTLEAGECKCSDSAYTYERTSCGEARAVVVTVTVQGKKSYTDGILLMNNDFTRSGLAVHLGERYPADEVVSGTSDQWVQGSD